MLPDIKKDYRPRDHGNDGLFKSMENKMIDNLTEAIAHERKATENLKEIASTLPVESEYYKGRLDEYLECIAKQEQLVAWLTELQECREKDRWIPVSERLPEDRKKVRVTAYWHERFQVMDASYYGDGVWWCVPFNNCGKHMRNDLHVIAWKPDDKPYESEDN